MLEDDKAEVTVEELPAAEEPKGKRKAKAEPEVAVDDTDPGLYPVQYEMDDRWGDTPVQMRS